MGFLIDVGTKFAQGVGKLVKRAKENKLLRQNARVEKAKAREAQVKALFEGMPNVADAVQTKAQDGAFGVKPISTPSGRKATMSDSVIQFLKDNWKLAVPSIIGLAVVVIGLILKQFKRKR